jgi:AraC-like DNA-binding protein
LYIPTFFFLEAKDELNLDDLTCPNHHGFVNPLTAQIVTAIAAAAEQGYPDLYAETAARFLATHLLLSSTKRTLKPHVVRDLPDARIERVLAYIEHHLNMHMTIATLSHEAGISPFHFALIVQTTNRRLHTNTSRKGECNVQPKICCQPISLLEISLAQAGMNTLVILQQRSNVRLAITPSVSAGVGGL